MACCRHLRDFDKRVSRPVAVYRSCLNKTQRGKTRRSVCMNDSHNVDTDRAKKRQERERERKREKEGEKGRI